MSINWDNKADSTHVDENTRCFYKKADGKWMLHLSGDRFTSSSSLYNGEIDERNLVERPEPQPKPWSGPEDGLPPINARLYMHLDESDEWILGTVIAHVTLEDGDVAVAHNGKDVFNGYASDFRAIWTPESRESERRETAIRELMDIAQVDCRVTAARLVDAGFKREVV